MIEGERGDGRIFGEQMVKETDDKVLYDFLFRAEAELYIMRKHVPRRSDGR
jgi:predicted TPR repeat methyltransferase